MAYITTLLANRVANTGGNATKSAYIQLIAATAAEYDGIILRFRATSGGVRMLVDIAVGAAAAEAVVIADIPLRSTSTTQPTVFIPLRFAAGVRIAVRSQGSGAGQSLQVSAWGVTGAFTSYATCTTYGADLTNTTGTVVDGGAVSNTEGAWVELTAACGADHDQLIVSTQSPVTNSGANSNVLVDIGTGAAAAETVILPDFWQYNGNGGPALSNPCVQMFPASTVASGSRIAARCQADSTDANGRTAAVIIHAMSGPHSSAGGSAVGYRVQQRQA